MGLPKPGLGQHRHYSAVWRLNLSVQPNSHAFNAALEIAGAALIAAYYTRIIGGSRYGKIDRNNKANDG